MLKIFLKKIRLLYFDICKFILLLVVLLFSILVMLGKCMDIWLFLIVCFFLMLDFIFCRIRDICGIDIIRGLFFIIIREFKMLVILLSVVMVFKVIDFFWKIIV